MLAVNHLYSGIADLEKQLIDKNIAKHDEMLIKIFTSDLEGEYALALARQIKKLIPNAKIIGASVCGVVYNGEQYDDRTLIVIEQYEKSNILTYISKWQDTSVTDLVKALKAYSKESKPRFMSAFFGGYYDYTHQFIDAFNHAMPHTQLAGGMAGEITSKQGVKPFVFTPDEVIEEGLVVAMLGGERLSITMQVNTAQKVISPVYTITEANEREICKIEHENASDWVEKQLGILSKERYKSWNDIAENDPLVRFQLMLEGRNGASRFIKYDENLNQISQYFSRLEPGTQFRMSYTSPSKFLEECQSICASISNYPTEQIFAYSCVFRKLYLANCAKWELLPYKGSNICGVFLLGEFSYIENKNELLNGSCVLTSIAENEKYIIPNTSVFENLYKIEVENNKLLDFLIKKQKETSNIENRILLQEVLKREKIYKKTWEIDPHLNMKNIIRYEHDKKYQDFDKLCLIRVENAEMLISCLGQTGYFEYLKNAHYMIGAYLKKDPLIELLQIYMISFNTFIIATDDQVSKESFVKLMEKIHKKFKFTQVNTHTLPLINKFVIVSDCEDLLGKAYNALQANKDSKVQLFKYHESDLSEAVIKNEIEMIYNIQYALTSNNVIPYYQGIYDNQKQCINKFESLMRIKDESGEIHTPYKFMDIAKKYKMYPDLSKKMITRVLEDFKTLDYTISINISANDIDNEDFVTFIIDKLKTYPKPENLIFEILEDECFKNIEDLKSFIAQIKFFGSKVAIDDFGSGYSNFLAIASIKPDYLKVDGEIIRHIHVNEQNRIVLETIAYLAQKLDVELIAEFVDCTEIQNQIEELGIAYSQGYYFSKPQPIEYVVNA